MGRRRAPAPRPIPTSGRVTLVLSADIWYCLPCAVKLDRRGSVSKSYIEDCSYLTRCSACGSYGTEKERGL